MIVYKFGGASVKSASAVRNVLDIVRMIPEQGMVLVISAMGKTTNKLEEIIHCINHKKDPTGLISELIEFHRDIILELLPDEVDETIDWFKERLHRAIENCQSKIGRNKNFVYDQIAALGELLSTRIINDFLSNHGVKSHWMDVRNLIRTNDQYRNALVDWETTESLVNEHLKPKIKQGQVIVTQGFIGSDKDGFSTTLGREGSDFTSAILAWCLDAESVTIWKDVPGVLNADPKYFPESVKLEKLPYREAVELSYYGASVIHPKTVKPLQNKSIPLYVKSFKNPGEKGTVIFHDDKENSQIPSYIFKEDQLFISITPKDFSFIDESHLSEIFAIFWEQRVRMNIMQTSAISFSISVDNGKNAVSAIEELKKGYNISIQDGVELLTIRHYDEATLAQLLKDKKVLLDQRKNVMARMVLKPLTQ